MAWNTTPSILGTGEPAREADVIFTAMFVGMALWKAERNPHTWRVDMEPSMDLAAGGQPVTRQMRTADDRLSMQRLNNVCSKVNHVVRSALGRDVGGVTWGLTPAFDKGGMIAGGDYAHAYDDFSQEFKKAAWKYLTDSAASDRSESMYIGRGAYCGLVTDASGDAITAMSTCRTTIRETGSVLEGVGVPVGDRWRPGTDSALFHGKDEGFTWGMIASRRLQHTLREQGMRFYGEPPEPTTDLVGYTHGMIRAIYECARIGEGTPYEMSIGGATAKLASCAACTTFMVANGYEPSSTHLGRGESWVPLYHAYGHNNSYKPDQTPILTAIQQCNETWARHVEDWVQRGVRAMQGQLGWVHEEHRPALEQLAARVAHPADGLACANLFLDALTVHDSDAKRIDRALVYGDAPRAHCHEGYDWARNTPEGPYIWEVFENPFTDETIRGFQALDQT